MNPQEVVTPQMPYDEQLKQLSTTQHIIAQLSSTSYLASHRERQICPALLILSRLGKYEAASRKNEGAGLDPYAVQFS